MSATALFPSARAVERAPNQHTALHCIANLERKVWQAERIGWPALYEVWLRELHLARLIAQRRGWRDEP